MFPARFAAVLLLSLCLATSHLKAAPDAAVRASVMLNADGSRTTLQTNPAERSAVSTTTGSDGKVLEKIQYALDESGRFLRAAVYGPREQFRFRAAYQYDGSGRVRQETRETKEGRPAGKIVFAYDSAGHQTGYSTYDSEGNLVAQVGSEAAGSSTPTRKR